MQSKRLTTWQVTVSVAASLAALLATAVHTAAYLPILLSLGIIAWVVYGKFVLAILRKAWLNLDVVWAAALVVTGLATLLM